MPFKRDDLIRRLQKAIWANEKIELTIEQVDYYIGSDMSNDKLYRWVDETESQFNPVTASDVLSLALDLTRKTEEHRTNLLNALRNTINSREKSDVSIEQVTLYVGDADDSLLENMVQSTINLIEPITAKDILDFVS